MGASLVFFPSLPPNKFSPFPMQQGRARQPIFFLYEVPPKHAAQQAPQRPQERPFATTTTRPRYGADHSEPGPCRGAKDSLPHLVALWTRLRKVPRGEHVRLAQAAEAFARAAMATEDTRWRRQALHSLIRELDRQHAALATRLSRERRDCPVTHVARNQVVMIKRHVRAVMRAHELAMHDGGDATVYGAPLPNQAARAECWTECARMDEDAMTVLRGLAYDASPFSSGGAADRQHGRDRDGALDSLRHLAYCIQPAHTKGTTASVALKMKRSASQVAQTATCSSPVPSRPPLSSVSGEWTGAGGGKHAGSPTCHGTSGKISRFFVARRAAVPGQAASAVSVSKATVAAHLLRSRFFAPSLRDRTTHCRVVSC